MIYKRVDSRFYWYSFMFDNKLIQHSTKCENKREAENIEKLAYSRYAHRLVGLETEKFDVNTLLERVQRDWRSRKIESQQNLGLLKKCREDWGTVRADSITAGDLNDYFHAQRKLGYAVASINRTFQCLRRALKLGKVVWPSDYKLESEKGNRRSGFLEPSQFEKVLRYIPNDGLRDFVEFGHATGMRKKEIGSLKWAFVQGDQIIIPGEVTKCGEPRTLPLAGVILTIIERRKLARTFNVNGTMQLCDLIFHRNGQPIREFRKSWKSACAKSGCGQFLFHDLRRSCVRDLIRANVPKSIAMSITGHRAESVFNRYDITATQEMTTALEKVEAYRKVVTA